MVTMIIFLVFSVFAILLTFLYLRKSKNKVKQVRKTTDKNIQNDSGKKNSKQLKDILGLKIDNSMISIENRYSCILRIGSIDYNMMSENEQETIENVLMQTALTFDGFVQFLTTTENIDTNEIINDIKKTTSKTQISNLLTRKKKKQIQKMKNLLILSFQSITSKKHKKQLIT